MQVRKACQGLSEIHRLISHIPLPEPEHLAVRFVKKNEAPDDGLEEGGVVRERRNEAWRLGVMLALVLTLHNLPEGVAVGLSTVKSEVRLELLPAHYTHYDSRLELYLRSLSSSTTWQRYKL